MITKNPSPFFGLVYDIYMIDILRIRATPEAFELACKQKNITLDVRAFLALDDQRKELITKVDTMRADRNTVSKKVPTMKGEEKEKAVKEMRLLGEELSKKEAELTGIELRWKALLLKFPSLPNAKVPVGKSDKDNVESKKVGTIRTFDFTPRDHVTLAEELDIMDIARGVKIGGNRSYFLKGDGARLEMAVLQFAINHLVKKGWTLFSPPLMVHWEALMGTGFFPGNEENTYAVGVEKEKGQTLESDQKYLIGTSEVAVASYHKDEVLPLSMLPTRYCGFSPCFRREAGAYGKDTKGLYRIHQFQKVEQVVLCEAKEEIGMALFEEIRTNAEEVLRALELPYRILDVCTGDMGQGKVFMQDIETWMPSRNAYGETHSCSYLGDFQARRLGIRYTDTHGEKQFVHTLNNTCIATPRFLIPLLELYQNKDGSIAIPEPLRPYMGGQTMIVRPKKLL